MKLYATTTSERASKGQGGNDFIDISIANKDGEEIFFLKIAPTKSIHAPYRVYASGDDNFLRVVKNHISLFLDRTENILPEKRGK